MRVLPTKSFKRWNNFWTRTHRPTAEDLKVYARGVQSYSTKITNLIGLPVG